MNVEDIKKTPVKVEISFKDIGIVELIAADLELVKKQMEKLQEHIVLVQTKLINMKSKANKIGGQDAPIPDMVSGQDAGTN